MESLIPLNLTRRNHPWGGHNRTRGYVGSPGEISQLIFADPRDPRILNHHLPQSGIIALVADHYWEECGIFLWYTEWIKSWETQKKINTLRIVSPWDCFILEFNSSLEHLLCAKHSSGCCDTGVEQKRKDPCSPEKLYSPLFLLYFYLSNSYTLLTCARHWSINNTSFNLHKNVIR